MFLVVRPPDTLFLPPSIVPKWRGLRGLEVRRGGLRGVLQRPQAVFERECSAVLGGRAMLLLLGARAEIPPNGLRGEPAPAACFLPGGRWERSATVIGEAKCIHCQNVCADSICIHLSQMAQNATMYINSEPLSGTHSSHTLVSAQSSFPHRTWTTQRTAVY